MKSLTIFPLSIRLTKTPLFSLLQQQTLVSTMAGGGELTSVDLSLTFPGASVESIVDDNLKFGFTRPEMYSESFPGKLNPYDRHVFLCYKSAESWPGKVEGSDSDPLPKKLNHLLQSRKNEIQGKTRFAVIEGTVDNGFSDGDVLIFPDMIKYKNVSDVDMDRFVEDVLVKGKLWANGPSEALKGSHVFVCCHTNRDKRCGVCGPALVEKLNEEIEMLKLKDQVFVSPCSHVGGHKYAGNLIIFGANSEGIVMGHWYGYVTPNDVSVLLDQHIGKGQIVERLWRGEVCNFQEEKKQTDEQKENTGLEYLENNLEKTAKEPQGGSTNGEVQNRGCCQGTNGFSCCMDEKVENHSGVAEKQPGEGSSTCAKGLGRMSAWMGKWEQSDVLAAAAVIGAFGSIAVAYSLYRRSG